MNVLAHRIRAIAEIKILWSKKMNTRLYYLIFGVVCLLRVQLCTADIVGRLMFPQFALFKGETEVILKDVKTGAVITKTIADKEGRFSLNASAKPLY